MWLKLEGTSSIVLKDVLANWNRVNLCSALKEESDINLKDIVDHAHMASMEYNLVVSILKRNVMHANIGLWQICWTFI